MVYRKLLREKKNKQIYFLDMEHTEEISDRKQTLWTDWSEIENSVCSVTVLLWSYCVLQLSLRDFLRYLGSYREVMEQNVLISIGNLCAKYTIQLKIM